MGMLDYHHPEELQSPIVYLYSEDVLSTECYDWIANEFRENGVRLGAFSLPHELSTREPFKNRGASVYLFIEDITGRGCNIICHAYDGERVYSTRRRVSIPMERKTSGQMGVLADIACEVAYTFIQGGAIKPMESIGFRYVSPGLEAVEIKDFYEGLIRSISEDRQRVFDLSPRQFEEFVASLLEREGYEVELTGKGSDGGIDIFAWHKSKWHSHLMLVQTKLYAPQNKVDVRKVRELEGVRGTKQAGNAMMVATSSYSAPAIKWVENEAKFVTLLDGEKLFRWIDELKG